MPAADQWAGKVVTVLSSEGADQAVSAIQAERTRKPKERPLVVVAGEDKRGKSSLVNALLQRPNLSPIGVEVTTGSPITFFKAPADCAYVFTYDDNERHPVEFEEARSLATVQGNPGNQGNVRSIQLGIDSPFLSHLVLVDTPGVGGLESGHAELTLARMRDADALLFVLEAGAQFRAHELAFLQRASERIHRVIFALTKVDAHRGWKQIMEDNRRILAEKTPRFADAPMLPVSSMLAQRAARLEEPAATALRDEAGLVALERVITEQVVARATGLVKENLVQVSLSGLGTLADRLQEEIDFLEAPEEAEQKLVAERMRLSELNQERAEWPMTLQVSLRRLGLDRGEELSRGLIELRSRYEERLKKVKLTDHETLPGEFVADLTAIAVRVNEWTEERFVELLVGLVGDLEKSAQISGSLRQMTDAGFAEEIAAVALGEHSLDTTEKISVLQSYGSGHMMGSMIGTGAIAFLGGPVGLAIGIAAGGLMAFTRFKSAKQSNYLQEFMSWMGEQTQRMQISVTNSFQRAQIDLENGIRDTLRAAFAEREGEISRMIAACQQAANEEQGARQARRRARQAKLETIRALEREGAALLAEAGTVPGGDR